MPRLDAYVWRARIVPAVLAAAPLLVFVAFVVKSPIVGVLTPAVGVLTAVLVAAEIARTLGLKTESRLLKKWNGLPTTRALRATEIPDRSRAARRSAIEVLAGLTLPSFAQQLAEPEASDEAIGHGVALALAKIRVGSVDSSLLGFENASYGFRRNCRGLKPIALIAIAVGLVVTIAFAVFSDDWPLPITVGLLDVLLAVYWLAAVRDAWVAEQAEKFARQFFVVAEIAAQ
jgi:hypothetical protein